MRAASWVLGAAVVAFTATAVAPAARAGGRSVAVIHPPDAPFPTLGPRHAPVTVEFFCNFNGTRDYPRLYAWLVQLAARHPRRLRVEFHIVGNAYSEAAYEAFVQGKFHAFARAAFASHRRPKLEHIAAWAAAAGVDYTRIERALATGRHRAAIRQAERLRARRGARGSRGKVAFNGEFQARKASNLDELEDTYDAHFHRAKALLDDGVEVRELFDRLVRAAARRRARPPAGPGQVDARPGQRPPPNRAPTLMTAPLDTAPWPSRGPATARVALTVACSMQSRLCRDLVHRVSDAVDVYQGDARLVVMPLFDPGVHRHATLAHEATQCAHDDGAGWRFLTRVFATFRATQLDRKHLIGHAAAVGLDAARFTACLDSHRHRAQVLGALRALRAAGVVYSPSLIAARRIYVGQRSRGEIAAIIEHALRPGLLERAATLRRHILDTVTVGAALTQAVGPAPRHR